MTTEERLREEMVRDCTDMIRSIASRMTTPVGVEFEDLVSTGFLAILEAAGRFAPERGIKFSTFTSRRVHGAMIDFLRDYAFGKRRNLEAEHTVLCTNHGDLSNVAERNPDWCPDAKIDAEDLMRKATGRDHQVLELRFCQDMPLKKIGALFGVTESRASQMVQEALARARGEPSRKQRASRACNR